MPLYFTFAALSQMKKRNINPTVFVCFFVGNFNAISLFCIKECNVLWLSSTKCQVRFFFFVIFNYRYFLIESQSAHSNDQFFCFPDSSPLSRNILNITDLRVTCLCRNTRPSQQQTLQGREFLNVFQIFLFYLFLYVIFFC